MLSDDEEDKAFEDIDLDKLSEQNNFSRDEEDEDDDEPSLSELFLKNISVKAMQNTSSFNNQKNSIISALNNAVATDACLPDETEDENMDDEEHNDYEEVEL